MYTIILSSGYRKAIKRIVRHKDFDHLKLEAVIRVLEGGQKLDPKYLDHELKGDLKGFRECHIQNDILLVYQKEEGTLILLLVNIGTHASLFQ